MSAGSSGSMEMQPEMWKPPMQTGRPAVEKRLGQIDRARKLVRLHADQADQAAAAFAADHVDDLAGADAPVGLIVSMQADIDAGAQHLRGAWRPRPAH